MKAKMKGANEALFVGLAVSLLKVLMLTQEPRKLWNVLSAKAEKEIAKREQKELEDEGESREADIKANR